MSNNQSSHEFLSWRILERFSRVTNATRLTAARIFSFNPPEPYSLQVSTSPSAIEDMIRDLPFASAYLAKWIRHPPSDFNNLWIDSDEDGDCGGSFEVISNECSLPKPCSKRSGNYLLTSEFWNIYRGSNFTTCIPPLSSDSVIPNSNLNSVLSEINCRIFHGGIEDSIRSQVWKFLFGLLPWSCSVSEEESIIENKTELYNMMKEKWRSLKPEDLSCEAWLIWQERKSLILKDVLRTDRTDPFFIPGNRFSANSTPVNASSRFPAIRANPESGISEDELLFDENLRTIDIDDALNCDLNVNLVHLANVLMTFVFYLNSIDRQDLGYVQGMSDLCSVLLMQFDGDEVACFWCFVGLMDRMQENFHANQQAMHRQLSTLKSLVQFLDFPLFKILCRCDSLNMFFAFRWLLVWFKREFSIPDVRRIWEVCMSAAMMGDKFTQCHEYQLFIALAMFTVHRNDLVEYSDFDSLLRYVNDLSGTFNVDELLDTAEEWWQIFNNKVVLISTPRGLNGGKGFYFAPNEREIGVALASQLCPDFFNHSSASS